MIFCNLSILLAERKLKISKVSSDTGISRTTLTSLSFNHWQGVRLETMDSLCKYLGVSVGDIFKFLPFDIKCVGCDYDKNTKSADVIFECVLNNFKGECHCFAEVNIHDYQKSVNMCVYLDEYDADTQEEERENNALRTIFKSLPVSIINDLKNDIADDLIDSILSNTTVECDGEIYGYPEDLSAWDCDVYLPLQWKNN